MPVQGLIGSTAKELETRVRTIKYGNSIFNGMEEKRKDGLRNRNGILI